MNAIDFYEQYQPVAVANEVVDVSRPEPDRPQIFFAAEHRLRHVVDQTAQPDLRDSPPRPIRRSCRHMLADVAAPGKTVNGSPSRLELFRGESAPSFN